MFEISWSELLILAVVTLIFVGPKDLPVFFNTLGRYAGVIRRQASEFRRHFEDAMREAELDRINDEVMGLKDQVAGTVKDAERAAEAIAAARQLPTTAAAARTAAAAAVTAATSAGAAATAITDASSSAPTSGHAGGSAEAETGIVSQPAPAATSVREPDAVKSGA